MDNSERLRLVILVGSAGRRRFGLDAGNWLAAQAQLSSDFDVDVIDLAKAWLPDRLSLDTEVRRPSAVRDLAPWLDSADAFAVVTPEFRRGYPASLKNAIDWYDGEWRAKPVAFLSYGDSSGGMCAVSQLRQVFAESHAVTVCETVSFHDASDSWDESEARLDTRRAQREAAVMLGRLSWWAHALRGARSAHPYDSADRPRVEG
jgi:NAD(P)H-dependent FMN reductase